MRRKTVLHAKRLFAARPSADLEIQEAIETMRRIVEYSTDDELKDSKLHGMWKCTLYVWWNLSYAPLPKCNAMLLPGGALLRHGSLRNGIDLCTCKRLREGAKLHAEREASMTFQV